MRGVRRRLVGRPGQHGDARGLRLRELLKAAKNQPDDPKEIPRLEKEIADLNAEIEKIRNE